MLNDPEWMRLLARARLREAEVLTFLAGGERPVRIVAGWPSARVVLLVHPDVANAGGWRVTRFDATGTVPEGHTEHSTFEDAARETRAWNANLSEAAEIRADGLPCLRGGPAGIVETVHDDLGRDACVCRTCKVLDPVRAEVLR